MWYKIDKTCQGIDSVNVITKHVVMNVTPSQGIDHYSKYLNRVENWSSLERQLASPTIILVLALSTCHKLVNLACNVQQLLLFSFFSFPENEMQVSMIFLYSWFLVWCNTVTKNFCSYQADIFNRMWVKSVPRIGASMENSMSELGADVSPNIPYNMCLNNFVDGISLKR